MAGQPCRERAMTPGQAPMSVRDDRARNSQSRTIVIALAVVAGGCLVGIACLVVLGVAGAGVTASGGGPGAGGPVVIGGSGVGVGADAPAFTLQSIDGETHSLNDYRGQVIFVNFWATWCPSCESEMPAIESVYEAYRDEGFVVLAINAGESAGYIHDFRREEGLTFPLLLDPRESVTDSYNIRALPTSVLVDRQGIIRRMYSGPITYGQLVGDVEELLQQQ